MNGGGGGGNYYGGYDDPSRCVKPCPKCHNQCKRPKQHYIYYRCPHECINGHTW